MRVFIAVEIEEELKSFLLKIQKKFKNPFLRNLSKDKLHITLSFIGRADEDIVKKLKKIFRALKQEFKGSIDLKAKRAMFGPTKSNPRLVWVDVESNKLGKIKNFIDKKFLEDFYLKDYVEKRPFKPHITISRIKGGSKIDWRNLKKEINLNFESLSTKITLFQSILKKGGAQYLPLFSINLSL